MPPATETKEQTPTTTNGQAPPATGSNLPATRQAAAPAVPVKMGIAPTNLDEGWRMAQMFAQTDLVPKDFIGKPAAVLVAIQMGMELGLPPMQAMQSIAVINGRPSIWGDGFMALIMGSEPYEDHDEYYLVDGERRNFLEPADLAKDATRAVCTFWRKGKREPVTRSFSIAQAKKASLWGKQGPWQTYPDRMMAMRARSWSGRDTFPDVLRGITTREEAFDAPIEVEELPQREVRRISESAPPQAGASTPADPQGGTTPASVVSFPGVQVKVVEPLPLLNQYVATLVDGETETQVVVETTIDAIELEKFVGGANRVTVVATKNGDALKLKSFQIAD